MTVRIVCVREGRPLQPWVCDVARFDWAVNVSWTCVGGGCGTCRFSFLISILGVSLFKQRERERERERMRMRCFYQKKKGRRKEIGHRFATSLAVPNGPFLFFNPPSYINTNTIPLILYYYFFSYYCWDTNIFIIIFSSSK